MIEAQLFIRSASGSRQVALADYLDPVAEESAHDAAYAWIKALRHLPVDGAAFRDRFTARGDSLWWFTEIYLHKEQVILAIHLVIRALTTLIERESPAEITGLERIACRPASRAIGRRCARSAVRRAAESTDVAQAADVAGSARAAADVDGVRVRRPLAEEPGPQPSG